MAMEAQVDRYAWFDWKIGAHLDRWIKIKRLVAAPAGLAAQTGGARQLAAAGSPEVHRRSSKSSSRWPNAMGTR
jgi:hypothetical protein